MTETPKLRLAYVQPSQAQKHVTVNEGFNRIDAVTQLTLSSQEVETPPVSPEDGEAYAVPDTASSPWSEQSGRVAIWQNQGWVYLTPQVGWRAWIIDEGKLKVWTGEDWGQPPAARTTSGATSLFDVIEVTHSVGTGGASSTVPVIPANSVGIGVTGRVRNDITGSLSSWQLGVPGSPTRYGTGLGASAGSFAMGLTGSPQTYYAETALELTAEGGSLSGGDVTLAVHYMKITPPE